MSELKNKVRAFNKWKPEDIKEELFYYVKTEHPVFIEFYNENEACTIAKHDGHINGSIGFFSTAQQEEILRVRDIVLRRRS